MEKPDQSPIYEGTIVRISAKRTSFWLHNITIDGILTELGARNGELQVLKRHWGDFGGLEEGDKVRFVIVENNVVPAPQMATAGEERKLDFGGCMGDRTIESLPNANAGGTPANEVIKLSWRDVFGPIGRWIRDLFARGLKARAGARS